MIPPAGSCTALAAFDAMLLMLDKEAYLIALSAVIAPREVAGTAK